MRCSAKTVEAQRAPVSCSAERTIANQPRTQERRGFRIAEQRRDWQAETSVGKAMGGKTPVTRETGEDRRIAEVLAA